MILWVLSGRVVVIMVLHGILKGVKDCEGISKRSDGEDVAKMLYKRGSLHDRKAWAQHLIRITLGFEDRTLDFKDRRQRQWET
jgi:Fe-S cluster biosynthesis and repair protein YggX